MRRPTDRQTQRRNDSGDPREICNLVPSRQARDFFIPVARVQGAPGISARAGVAGLRDVLTHVYVRSAICSAGAFARTVCRSRLAPGVAI